MHWVCSMPYFLYSENIPRKFAQICRKASKRLFVRVLRMDGTLEAKDLGNKLAKCIPSRYCKFFTTVRTHDLDGPLTPWM
jgi:hypothetical protein